MAPWWMWRSQRRLCMGVLQTALSLLHTLKAHELMLASLHLWRLESRAIKECYVDLACLDVAPHRPLRLCISGAICCEPQRTLKSHFGFTSVMLDSLVNDATLHSTIDRQFCSQHVELQAALPRHWSTLVPYFGYHGKGFVGSCFFTCFQ